MLSITGESMSGVAFYGHLISLYVFDGNVNGDNFEVFLLNASTQICTFLAGGLADVDPYHGQRGHLIFISRGI